MLQAKFLRNKSDFGMLSDDRKSGGQIVKVQKRGDFFSLLSPLSSLPSLSSHLSPTLC